jgi:hypothetical protein
LRIVTDALQHHRGLPAAAYRDPLIFALLSFALPGLLATSLIGLGAIGVGWLPLDTALYDFALVDTIRTTDAGIWLSRLMVFVGVGLLLQTWLVLGSDLSAGLTLRFSTLSAILAAWTVPLLFVPPLFSRDVYAYLAQGRLVSEGYDPYAYGVSQLPGWFIEGVDPMWGETPSPYGPLFLMIARGVAVFVGDQAFLAAVLFRLLAVLGMIAMLFLVPRLAAYHGIDTSKAVWLAVLNPLVIMHFVAGGHNDAVMVAFLLAAFYAASRGSIAWAATHVALATSIKPIALLALPFVGLMRTPRDWTWGRRIWDWVFVSLVAGAVFLVTAVIAGVGFGWINALSTPGTVQTWLSPMTALGMIVGFFTQTFGSAQTNEVPVAIFRSIGLVISLVIVTMLALRPQGRSGTRAGGLAMLAVVILGPVVQPWYLLWFIPLLVVTGLTQRQLRATILVTAALSVHGMVDGSATSDALLEFSNGVSLVLAVAFVAVILIASPRERRLALQQDSDAGLQPETPQQQAAAQRALIGPPVSAS